MSYNLIPRFYYTLPIYRYFKWFGNSNNSGIFSSAVHYNNARTGLRVLLSSIGNKQLKIGVQAYTCHTVFQAIQKAGHIPVFIDLTDEFKLDLNDLQKKANEIDVLIVTHTFGFPDDIASIKIIIGDKIIIEDCAHSFLSKYKGQYTGTLSDAAIFSMGLGKFPPIGSGGLCIVNKPNKFPFIENEKITKPSFNSFITDFIKTLVYSVMMKPPLYGLITYKVGKALDKKMDLGHKFSFNELRGYSWANRLLNTNWSLFEKTLNKQSENANLLSSLMLNKKRLNKKDVPNYYAFPILVNNRDSLYNKLFINNIESGKHFYKSIEWAKEFGYNNGECPNTEKIVDRIIVVPTHIGVNKSKIHKIASIINNYAK